VTGPESKPNERNDDGFALTLFLVAFTLGLLAACAVSIDGGRILTARRAASSAAFAAARVGAQSYQLDSGTAIIDEGQAAGQAAAYLDGLGYEDHAVTASATAVTVTVRNQVNTVLLRLVGVRSAPVTATATARPAAGIATEGA
jgi:Flp pilus assembly protein TadG